MRLVGKTISGKFSLMGKGAAVVGRSSDTVTVTIPAGDDRGYLTFTLEMTRAELGAIVDEYVQKPT